MNRKKFALTAASLLGIGTYAAVKGYNAVMAREKKPNPLLAKIAKNNEMDNFDAMIAYTEKSMEWVKEQNTTQITMTSRRGDSLQGFLTMSPNNSKCFAVCAHGYRSDHNGDPANFMRYYIEKGFNFLTFDHVSQGESSGKYVGFDYFESVDFLDWLDFLITRFGQDIKIIIHGVSMGGATVCKIVDKIPPQVKFAVADCPYTCAMEEFDETIKSVGIKRTKEILFVFNQMNKIFAGFDLKETDVRESVKNSKVPILFIHGNADDFVPTRMGIELYNLCGNEKELFLVDDAPHAQSIMYNPQGYCQKIDEFIGKYI